MSKSVRNARDGRWLISLLLRVRQDFPRRVVEALAKRTGFLCSNPACRCSTVGPHLEGGRAVLVGVAAHITAASPGGPRFDASLTESQRRSPENGIWLCQKCAKLIDSDIERYDVPLLLSWKAQAEKAAAQKIGHSVESTLTTALNSAPPLPSYYVARPETLARVGELMVNDAGRNGASPGVCAIHGMGGIGKSTIAAAFCHDSAVRNYFQEGVLWATLGLNPDILSILGDWIQLLGDYEFKPSTIGTAAARFRSLASDRQVLVVLDDAWNPGDVSPFAVGGRVRTLLTTRELDVARYLDSAVIEVDPFTPQQCLDMFSLALGKPLLAETIPQAERLASLLGRLPLALELAIAQIKDGVSWANLNRELEGEIVKLDALSRPDADEEKDEFARKRLSLRACFHLSLKRLKTQEVALDLHGWAFFATTPPLRRRLWQRRGNAMSNRHRSC